MPSRTPGSGGLFRRDPAIDLVFVQFWGEDEQVFSRGVPEPQYLSDPSARAHPRPARGLDGGRGLRRGPARCRDAQDARRSSDSGPTGSQGRAGGQGRARAVPRARGPLPVRAPPVAPRPLGLEVLCLLVTEPRLHGLGEAALVHVRDRAAREPEQRLRARAVPSTARTASSPDTGPSSLAGPRAAQPAESRARRGRRRFRAVGTSRRRPPARAAEPLRRRVCPRPRRLRNSCYRALFRLLLEFASHLLTELELRRHRSMILHLTMATEASGSTCGSACRPPRRLARRADSPALVKIGGDHSDGGDTCVSVQSCSSRERLAIVASLVVGPAATAGPEQASAGTVVFIHDQEPPNLRAAGSATTCMPRPRSQQHLVRRPDPRQQRAAGSRGCSRARRSSSRRTRSRRSSRSARRRLVGRQARHRRRLEGDVAGLHQPGEQRHRAARVARTSSPSLQG